MKIHLLSSYLSKVEQWKCELTHFSLGSNPSIPDHAQGGGLDRHVVRIGQVVSGVVGLRHKLRPNWDHFHWFLILRRGTVSRFLFGEVPRFLRGDIN